MIEGDRADPGSGVTPTSRIDPEVAAEVRAGPPKGFWAKRSPWRRASLVVLLLASVITGMMVTLGIGMWRNDMVIDAAPVRTTATVLTVSALSTGIEFVDNQGLSQRPPAGVLYPGGLTVGQQFLVEYAATDPTLARVAGRSAINGLIMPALVLVGAWLISTPLLWWLRRRDRMQPLDLQTALALAPLQKRWFRRRR